ncbi:MAG: TauD/TfdA family dioxygenase [Lentisphaeria bacterium]|nr:TauD/TfdA family dioxygenase [Lentisphaeria bacterium]
MEAVNNSSAWTGNELQTDKSWEFNLSPEQQDDLSTALQVIKDRGLPFAEMTRDDFQIPSLSKTIQGLLDELRDGRGIAVLRNVPVDEDKIGDMEKLFWGLCTHMGTAVTQNSEAGLIHCVTDGKLRPKKGSRGLGDPREISLHVDLSDCVALYCLRQAPDDPRSLFASSMNVYNEILKHHPEYLPRLYEGFIWSRVEPRESETLSSNFKIPAYSTAGGRVTCRFHPGWIRDGMERAGETLSEEEEEIFAFIRELAYANAFPLHLRKGDIVFCNNYLVFHGRDQHGLIDDEDKKRVLLRIWMDLPDVRPFSDEGSIRYGAIRHGNMGWTAAEILSGDYKTPHRRREDGVPEVL